MSGADDTMTGQEPERDDAMLAAEHALGLLEGEELLDARGRLATDEEFAWRREWWDGWFAPLTDEVAGMEPRAHVWEAIDARVNAATVSEGGDVVDLQSRLRRWQWTAGLTSAAATVMLAVMVFAPGTGPEPMPGQTDAPTLAAADPLVAQVSIGETGLRLDVTYLPESEKLLVGAIGLTADGVHDHELWLVLPDDRGVESLGVVTPGEVRAHEIDADLIADLNDGAEIVLTREPLGGKPEGVDAGPVVAQGAFTQV